MIAHVRSLPFIAIALAIGLATPAVSQTPAAAPKPSYLRSTTTLAAADGAQIIDIIGRMNQAIDAADYPAYSLFYTEQGSIDSGFGPPVVGRNAIVASLNQSAPFITNKRHVSSNIVIHGDGRTATAVYYLTVFERAASLSLAGTAVITDVFRKTGNVWAVTSHTTRMDPATLKAMAAVMGSTGAQ